MSSEALDARPLSGFEMEVETFAESIAADGDKEIGPFFTQGFAYITGLLQADAAVTVSIYQGHRDDNFPYVNESTHGGDDSDGQGLDFNIKVRGRFAKIVIHNPTVGSAAIDGAFYITKGTV